MAPIYDYKALTAEGKPQRGIVESDTAKNARLKLKKAGLAVTEIFEKNAARPRGSSGMPFIGNRVSMAEVGLMIRQLASLVKANVPLVEALTALVDQTENEKLKVIIAQVRQDVNEGSSLAKAVSKHPKIFDTIFTNMIEAGETSGTLGLVLIRLADFKDAQIRLRNKIITAMTYPVLMMGISFILILGIFGFVMPRLGKVFVSMNKPMPASTQFLMFVSDVVVNWWFLIAGAIFGGLVFFRRYITSPNGRPKWDALKLRIPIFGPLVRMTAMTRFASTMATLLSSGVPILTCMTIAKNLVDNDPIAKAILSARENITEGQSIAEPLRKSGEFPPMMIHMIAIGEKTGELPDMLRNVAETYEQQVSTRVESMTSLLEPVMIIGMGGAVGFVVMSVILPLLDISNINPHR